MVFPQIGIALLKWLINWRLQVFTGSSWAATRGPATAGCALSRSGSWRPTCPTPSSPRARRPRGWRTNSLPNCLLRSLHARRIFFRHPDLLKPMQVSPVIYQCSSTGVPCNCFRYAYVKYLGEILKTVVMFSVFLSFCLFFTWKWRQFSPS